MLSPLAGYKTYIAATVALAAALGGALDGDMTWQQAAAIIVPSIIGAAVRHGISTTNAALLQTVVEALAQAADQAARKAGTALAVALAAAMTLVACTAQQSATVDQVSQAECKVLTWGQPLVAGLDASGKLDPNGQAILRDVNGVLTAGCQNGDTSALARVPDLAKALVAILYTAPPKAV